MSDKIGGLLQLLSGSIAAQAPIKITEKLEELVTHATEQWVCLEHNQWG